jgi:carbamoyltransferase
LGNILVIKGIKYHLSGEAMYILGITCYGHDSSAAILKDGNLITAVEEERFVRKKHTYEFPIHSINHCLDECGITMQDVSHVGYYLRPWIGYSQMVWHFLKYFPKSLNLISDRMLSVAQNDYVAYGPLTNPVEMLKVGRRLRRIFKKDSPKFKFHFIEHHLCHQASSFLVSPFEEAASLSIDGAGEWTTTMMAHGQGNHFKVIGRVSAPHSLGTLYNSVCEYLGFTFLDGPGKVMGLASYGDPERYYPEFRKMIMLNADGTFKMDFSYFDFHVSRNKNRYSKKFVSVFGPPREKSGELNQHYYDVAAGLQKLLEETCSHIIKSLQRKTKSKNLCLSGGVALNSVMNGKILQQGIFENIFVQAAASDAGCSIGAAFYIHNMILRHPRDFVFKTACIGKEFTEDQILEALENTEGATFKKMDNVPGEAARLLADGKILGWFQGRAEFGPRALGCRSIVTAPFPAEMKDVLNHRVKHREPFRPFAPVILQEKTGEYFDMDCSSPFMLLVFNVKPDKREVIPAVTHVDNTGRVQTVTKEENGLFYELVASFEKITGIPVILNTSFNVQGEPIVNSPHDALNCFLTTDIDYLVLGNYLVSK